MSNIFVRLLNEIINEFARPHVIEIPGPKIRESGLLAAAMYTSTVSELAYRATPTLPKENILLIFKNRGRYTLLVSKIFKSCRKVIR